VEAGRDSVFFGGWLGRDEVASIRFGDEGQGWELMPVATFLGHARAVPEMQRRAGVVWREIGAARGAEMHPSDFNALADGIYQSLTDGESQA